MCLSEASVCWLARRDPLGRTIPSDRWLQESDWDVLSAGGHSSAANEEGTEQ